MKQQRIINFWTNEQCEYCNGRIVEKRTDLHRKIKRKHILIENVPAGVCVECGTRYYTANVLKMVEELVRKRQKATREVLVPIYSL